MTIDSIENLLAASFALLTAEEHLLRADRAESGLAYDLAATVMRLARDFIGQAVTSPGDATQKAKLVLAAGELDGLGSPLMLRAAAALAECDAA